MAPQNMFRYKTFGEHISNIDIRKSALYYVGHSQEDLPTENETYFYQSLNKWCTLNLTNEFNVFHKKYEDIRTLPQLLHKTEHIINDIMEKLNNPQVASIQPFFEILVAVARDLRCDFYKYFFCVLEKLIQILKAKQPQLIEWTIICLAFLFKILKPYLKRDILHVFDVIFPLLDMLKQPEHVTNFAIECIAFLFRGIKDYSKIVSKLVDEVRENAFYVKKCGRILMEISRGVKGKFHSNALNLFEYACLRGLQESDDNAKIIFHIMESALNEIMVIIRPKDMNDMLNMIANLIDNNLDILIVNRIMILNMYLNLLLVICEYKSGFYIKDETVISTILRILYNIIDKQANISVAFYDLIATIFTASSVLTRIDTNLIMNKILVTSNDETLEHFSLKMCNHEHFEKMMLPVLVDRLDESFSDRAIYSLGKVILNKVSPATIKLCPSLATKIIKYVSELMPSASSSDNNMEKLLLSLFLICHMDGTVLKCANNVLKKIALNYCDRILDEKQDRRKLRINIFGLSLTIEGLIHIDADIEDIIDKINTALVPHCSQNEFTCPLKILDLLTSHVLKKNKGHIYMAAFWKVHETLSKNLSSSSSTIRRLSAHILQGLSNGKKDISLYSIMFQTESIQSNVHTFREKSLLLQKMSPDLTLYKSATENCMKIDCLKYMCGLLFESFSLIWEPVLKLIEAYSQTLSIHDFWSVFGKQLVFVAKMCKKARVESIDYVKGVKTFDNEVLNCLYSKNIEMNTCVDFNKYRDLLWRNVHKYGVALEQNISVLRTLLLEFIEEEYLPLLCRKSKLWNVQGNFESTSDSKNKINADEIEESMSLSTTKIKSKLYSKDMRDTLAIKLETFNKIYAPQHDHEKQKLYEVYSHLLMSTCPRIQKLAFDCIIGYKEKHVLPYIENLQNIIDEKKLKSALTRLKIDISSNQIAFEHKQALMPLIMKILLGKLTMKGTKKNFTYQARRNLIIKFLNGCESTEILYFLSLAFDCCNDVAKEDFHQIPKAVNKLYNVCRVLPAKRLMNVLSLIDIIRKHFGCAMHIDVFEYILKVLLVIGAVSQVVTDNSEHVTGKFFTMYKNLRSASLLSLTSFFEILPSYEWKKDVIDAVFNIFVWNSIEKLKEDCIHAPTPLLKLFCVWCHNKNHVYYLIETSPKTKRTCLSYMMEILTERKAHINVYDFLMDGIHKIVSIEDTENSTHNSTVGISILVPYFTILLDRYMEIYSKSKTQKNLTKRDVSIICKICKNITGTEICSKMFSVMLAIILKKVGGKQNEDISYFLNVIIHLVDDITEPEIFFKSLISLFAKVSCQEDRRTICLILQKIECKVKYRYSNIEGLSEIAFQLNAVDKKWVQQPNYEARLRALRQYAKNMECSPSNLNISLVVTYNCFYYLRNDCDMGMRNNCLEYLKEIVPAIIKSLSTDKQNLLYYINDVVLRTIREYLTDNKDSVVSDSLQVLGKLAALCPECHPVLGDMNYLISKTNSEDDFFENITHIQVTKHGRALQKYISVAKSKKNGFNSKTLSQFILPLCSRYIYNDKLSKKHTLINAAIDAMGVTCRMLPWQQYQAILRYYLKKMRFRKQFHKQSVRIVIEILDAFHFDLSRAAEDTNQPALTSENNNLALSGKNCIDVDTIVLAPSAARQVVHEFITILIPSLNNSITELSAYDTKHKLNKRKRSKEREDEETLRVPIGLAVIKLLQKMPEQVLSSNVAGVLMKVCTFLKSPLKSVRMLARDFLKKIIQTLGVDYLSLIVDQLCILLTRGFQVHVLSVTIHGILEAIRDKLTPKCLEHCLSGILRVCLNDIFGDISFEKEIEKIGAQTPEAKPSMKSYLILSLIARNIKTNSLLDMITPFKLHVSQANSKKSTIKISLCLQKIAYGLIENDNVTLEDLLIFIFGIISDSISNIKPEIEDLNENESKAVKQTDCFLLKNLTMGRIPSNKTPKINKSAGFHIFTEFGYQLLYLILKRRKVSGSNYEQFLNPIAPLLINSLESTFLRISTLALKCISSIWNSDRIPIKIVEHTESIVTNVFKILHKYSTSNAVLTGENGILVKSAFKSLVVLLRKCHYHTMSNDDLKNLFYYIEQDINSDGNNSVGFVLLKSVISRKLDMPEVDEIMQKMCEIAINSIDDDAKREARNILLYYTMHSRKTKKINKIVKFFINHLKYEMPSGKLSAILFLQLFSKKTNIHKLNKRAELLFLSLGTRLVNENIPEYRLEVARCIENILSRVGRNIFLKLWRISVHMLEGSKSALTEMAVMLCARFVDIATEEFYQNVKNLFNILTPKYKSYKEPQEGKYVLVREYNKNENKNGTESEVNSHELVQIGNCLLKIQERFPIVLEDNDLLFTIDTLAYNAQELLGHDHEWVRHNSIKILNRILSTYNYTLVRDVLLGSTSNSTGREFIFSNPAQDIKSLCLDICSQLRPKVVNAEFANDTIEILLQLAHILRNVLPSDCTINIQWLLRRIQYCIQSEIVETPKEFLLRFTIFKWVEGLLAIIDNEVLKNLLPSLFTMFQRELSDNNVHKNDDLNKLVLKISNKIRKRIDDEYYDKIQSNVRSLLLRRKAIKRKQIAQEKIADPVRAATRKRSRIEKKKISKLRRASVF